MTNEDRANAAYAAILAFESEIRGDRGDSLCDLLCNLRHWAHQNGFDYGAEDRRGLMHFEAELEEEDRHDFGYTGGCRSCGRQEIRKQE